VKAGPGASALPEAARTAASSGAHCVSVMPPSSIQMAFRIARLY